jgi:RNA polymerase sigma-70 factor (ECF subfamily)
MQTTEELVAAAQSGDRHAFAELVRRYERTVLATAWSVLRDYHCAQDVAQESFVIAFRKLESLRSAKTFGTWLLAISQREAVRRSQKKPTSVSLDSVSEPQHPTPVSPWAQDYSNLTSAIGKLPNHEKEVLVFHYLDGHTVREIAELTSRPLGTVTKQLSRAVVRLRQSLERVSP